MANRRRFAIDALKTGTGSGREIALALSQSFANDEWRG